MEPIKSLTSACKYCRNYKPEGRRGGVCQQLGVPVQGSWSACSLAVSPFTPSWKDFEEAWNISDAQTAIGSSLNPTALANVKASSTGNSQQPKPVTVKTV
ncbi:hypothetical protein [Calothrix rhizosoleniae]|uniref:hypothetical protein n=1 Tax=Calothrix rhizosoleniae TaxID=888997 RepID=UPI000B49AB64|nr:hypothetical protein [Calothrix rhizosoleniae]